MPLSITVLNRKSFPKNKYFSNLMKLNIFLFIEFNFFILFYDYILEKLILKITFFEKFVFFTLHEKISFFEALKTYKNTFYEKI